jgi:hypothetical protein
MLPDLDLEADTIRAAEMLSSIPASFPLASEAAVIAPMTSVQAGMDDHADARSSSLSELGDASDDHSEPTPRPHTAAESIDNDSEAETERLEQTPRKLTRAGTVNSMTSEHLYERTPSKLAHSTTLDEDESVPPSPTLMRAPDASAGNAALDTLSFLAASEAVSLELAGKKRKRSTAEHSSVDEPNEEPARKRSGGLQDLAVNGSHEVDVEEELDNAEERLSNLAQEEIELEERQADVASETVAELATVAKITKTRKGRGRAKRKVDEGVTAETLMAEAQDVDGDGDDDEEDSAALHEEGEYAYPAHAIAADISIAASKKKNAIDELAKIQKKFKIFRDK